MLGFLPIHLTGSESTRQSKHLSILSTGWSWKSIAGNKFETFSVEGNFQDISQQQTTKHLFSVSSAQAKQLQSSLDLGSEMKITN